ncbi:MAG: tRNA pseudouridine(55) synthase TruB [Gammaproteobacteria bacterium]|nr:MAG: tRNA pseudouridine(55) synthase TruB [Gammaproteobacteria bacterium]
MSRRKNKGRALNGLLLFDKPAGESSNLVLQKVKRIFNAAKAGHTGTLDPLATGLLVICFGRTTKISDYLLAVDKQYRVVLKLGVTTDSADADGVILEQRDASKVTKNQILQHAASLTGSIEQIPPMYSALKYQGSRLYELARKGIEVERAPRKVEIHNFELIEQQQDLVTMQVHCSKGTYIRTLVEDLGKLLLCGAHVVELRRTSLGPFTDPKMYCLEELEQFSERGFPDLDQTLLPTDHALQDWPAISIGEDQMVDIRNGHAMRLANLPAQGLVRIYEANQQFYGIGTIREDGRMAPKPLY